MVVRGARNYYKMKGIALCVLSISLALTGVSGSNGGSLVLSSVSRELDLTTPLVQQKVTMVIENTGSNAVSEFKFTVDPSFASKTSFVGAKVSSNKCTPH